MGAGGAVVEAELPAAGIAIAARAPSRGRRSRRCCDERDVVGLGVLRPVPIFERILRVPDHIVAVGDVVLRRVRAAVWLISGCSGWSARRHRSSHRRQPSTRLSCAVHQNSMPLPKRTGSVDLYAAARRRR